MWIKYSHPRKILQTITDHLHTTIYFTVGCIFYLFIYLYPFYTREHSFTHIYIEREREGNHRTTRKLGTSCGVMVSKLDWQTYASEFESHWVSHSYDLVLHLSKKLSKLLLQESNSFQVLGDFFSFYRNWNKIITQHTHGYINNVQIRFAIFIKGVQYRWWSICQQNLVGDCQFHASMII